MTASLPLLYLPDAISLILGIGGATLLRRSAVDHLRVELARLRREIALLCGGLDSRAETPAQRSMTAVLDALGSHAARVSPARLYFVRRQLRRMSRPGTAAPRDSVSDLTRQIERVDDARVRGELQRVQTEVGVRTGWLFLMGSLSGWMVLARLACRITVGMFRQRTGRRLDWSMDILEKLSYTIGRRVMREVFLIEAPADVLDAAESAAGVNYGCRDPRNAP